MLNFSFSLPWNNRPASNTSAPAGITRPPASGAGGRALSSPLSMREAVGQTAGRILLGSCKTLAVGGAVVLTGFCAHAAYSQISGFIGAYFNARNLNKEHVAPILNRQISILEEKIKTASIRETDKQSLMEEVEEIKHQVTKIANARNPFIDVGLSEKFQKIKELSEELERYVLNTPSQSS